MGAAKYMGGYKLVRDLVASEMEAMNITVPVVMHLDHGNYEHTCLRKRTIFPRF